MSSPPTYRFGPFELIASRFELRRDGRIIKLERIPMDLLILLAERDGDLVTRPDIVERLWGKEIHVDTEHGINTAVRKIRAALGEDAEQPRFVHTVPGKGYRLAIDHGSIASVADASVESLHAQDAVPRESETAGAQAMSPAAQGSDVVPDAWPDFTHVDAKSAAAPIAAPSRKPWRVAAAAAIVALVGGVVAMRPQPRANTIYDATTANPIRSIAVLPLANLSNDRSQEYLADGMTDELITSLANGTSLRVISHTSVKQYKGTMRPLREIARELGVDSVVEGSVTRTAAGVHMTLRLIRASTDTLLWAESFDRDREDAFALSLSVTETIARVVGATATRSAVRTVNPEAHDAYLQGRYFWFADEYDRSQQYLEKAIQAQPDYALAWSGLADVYAVRAVAGLTAPQPVMLLARSALAKALELDHSLPEAHLSVGAVHLFYDWNFQLADQEARRVIESKPNLAEVHHLRSYIMLAMNRPSEALQEQQRATELDPFARPWALGFVLMHLRQFDAALNELQVRKAAQPHERFTRLFLSLCYSYKHMDRAAAMELAEAFRLFGNEHGAAAILKAFTAGGSRAIAELRLRELQARAHTSYVSPLELAHAHAQLGHREQALGFLEAAVRDRAPFLVFLQSEPDFDFLHADSRYESIVQHIGLSIGQSAAAH